MAKAKSKSRNKGKSNSKGPKFTKRQRDIESEDMRSNSRLPAEPRGNEDYHTGKPNDWRWYAASPQLIIDYASYPFGTPVGSKTWTQSTLDRTAVPGVMVLGFVPSVGKADSEVDPINVAMRKLYSFVRYQNSGAKNYDAPDLMLYMLAVDSCYMYLAWMKRIYGVALKDYTPFNRYYPGTIVQGMGVNFQDVVSNIVKLRGYINQYAFKLTQLFIPNSMSFMARHSWMCEGIYTDSTSSKAQTYLFNPEAYYQFTYDTSGAGKCQYLYVSQNMTVEDVISYGEQLLGPLIANEDFGIMSGDILKAFGEGGIVKPAPISEDYQVLPVYDQEVLSQIENATILNGTISSTGVTQATDVGTGYLISSSNFNLELDIPFDLGLKDATSYNQLITNLMDAMGSSRLINFHHDSVTPADVMVATRLTNILSTVGVPTFSASQNQIWIPATCETFGTEVVTRCRVYGFGTPVNSTNYGMMVDKYPLLLTNIYSTQTESTVNSLYNMLNYNRLIAGLSTFDWHPQMWTQVLGYNGTTFIGASRCQRILDVDNYTIIDAQNLKQMMLAADRKSVV